MPTSPKYAKVAKASGGRASVPHVVLAVAVATEVGTHSKSHW